jgi:hypothetical protein
MMILSLWFQKLQSDTNHHLCVTTSTPTLLCTKHIKEAHNGKVTHICLYVSSPKFSRIKWILAPGSTIKLLISFCHASVPCKSYFLWSSKWTYQISQKWFITQKISSLHKMSASCKSSLSVDCHQDENQWYVGCHISYELQTVEISFCIIYWSKHLFLKNSNMMHTDHLIIFTICISRHVIPLMLYNWSSTTTLL